MEGSEVGKS